MAALSFTMILSLLLLTNSELISCTSTESSVEEASSTSTYTSDLEWDGINCSSLQDIEICNNTRDIDKEIEDMYKYITPDPIEYVLMFLHVIIFVCGFVGNFLTVYAVMKNHSMHTVTNYFIVNLALADLLVIVTCLPFTLIWDITETWFFGRYPCKIVLYFQTVSVTVSVSTLVYISSDRWYAISSPLQFKSTTTRAKRVICVIWVFALLLDVLELVEYEIYTPIKDQDILERTMLFTQCGPIKWSMTVQMYVAWTKFIVLYVAPLTFMAYAYSQIARVLWSTEIPGHNLSTRITNANELSSQASMGNTENQIRSRRKAARMLIAVIGVFAICCLPVHVFSIYRATYRVKATPWMNFWSCFVHLIFYANSAINPIIYNFMSGKFRKEFKRLFADCWCRRSPNSRNRSVYQIAGNKSRNLQSVRSTSCNNSTMPTRFALTIFSNNNNNNTLRHSTEIVPLSGICNSPSGYQHHQSMNNHSETIQ